MEARFFDIWEDQLDLREGQKIQRMDCASEVEKPMTLRSEVRKILKLSLTNSAKIYCATPLELRHDGCWY